MRFPFLTFLLFTFCLCFCYKSNSQHLVSIVTDIQPSAPVSHGINKLEEALRIKKNKYEQINSIDKAKGDLIIITGLAYGEGTAAQFRKQEKRNVSKEPGSLIVWKTKWHSKPVWVASGFDHQGVMYGLQDVAIRASWGSNTNPFEYIKEIVEKPDLSTRAISLYTMNRSYWESRFYDEAYWKRYLDMLSDNRFNSLVIIFGYENGGFLAPPYPYFFNVDGYPDIKMVGLKAEEQQRNLNALNRLIDMAHERGIKLSVAIWDHIFRGGVQSGGLAGLDTPPDKPVNGLVWGLTADNLIPYTKAALARFVQMVPKLDGIEFRMHNESGLKKDEQVPFWVDVFHSMKSLEMQFVLRAKDMPEAVIQAALKEGIHFKIETKYWMEQMGLPFHPTHINKQDQQNRRHGYADMLRYPQEYKMYWRLWNGGTSRILLWGSPDYARRFTQSAKLYNSDTYEVTEPVATKMESQPHDEKPFGLLNAPYRYYDYEFERYWHFFQVFGRIGYNPQQSSDIWQKEYEMRFGKKAGPVIEKAIHEASWILPRIVATCYPYAAFPTTRGWAEKQALGNLAEYAASEGSDLQQFASFDDEARLLIEGGESARLLPSVNSTWFEQASKHLDKLILDAETAIGENGNKEFISTITDLKILSKLALFHSRRIPAAVSYCIFKRTKDPAALDKAIQYEQNAIEAWKQVVASAGDVYADDLKMGIRSSYFDGLTHHLTGHWKTELDFLEESFKKLEEQRTGLKTEPALKNEVQYRASKNADNANLFQVNLQKISSAPIGRPLVIKAKVTAINGVKWVRLRYRAVNQRLEYATLPMVPKAGKGWYEVTVPANEIDPGYDFMYLLEVMDKKGNGKIYPDFNQETPYVITSLIR